MPNRDRLHGDNTAFVALFARAPQLCAAALAGLGSALWLNVVGPFAELVAAWGALILANALAIAVVAILMMLVTTAGTLLAADWRADAARHQVWAEIGIAATELHLPARKVAPPQIDPRYLMAANGEPLRSVFDAHCFTAPAPELEAARCSTRIVAAPGGSVPPAKLQGVPTSSRKIDTHAASDVALIDPTCRRAATASLGQELLIVASRRALKRISRAQRAVSAPRLVANGRVRPEWLPRHVPSDGPIGHIIVLGGDRDRRVPVHDPPTGGSIVGSVEPPNCRGPPPIAIQRSGARETPPAKLSLAGARQVHAPGTLPTSASLVVDDLGHPVPVCAAELDVIETYLSRALQDLLGQGVSVPDREKS
jgi:hypothetical protein